MSSNQDVIHPSQALARAEQGLSPVILEGPGLDSGWDLLTYLRILRYHWRLIGAVAGIVLAGSVIGTFLMGPVYRAAGLLEIGNETPDIVPVETLYRVEPMSNSYLQTQFGVLKSEAVARQVIRQLDLEGHEEFNPLPPWWSWRVWLSDAAPGKTQVQEGILNRYQARLSVEPVKDSRLVKVYFESGDPRLAARVVNSLFNAYINLRFQNGQRTTDWLAQQMERTKSRLEQSETELQAYARRNGLFLLESASGDTARTENLLHDRLRKTQQELGQAEADRYEKEALFRLLQEGERASLPPVVDNRLLQDLSVRLADLKRQHAELATLFTADYPKLKQVKRQIDALDALWAAEMGRVTRRIQNEYRAAAKRETLLENSLAEQRVVASDSVEKMNRYSILKREVDANKRLYDILQQRLKESEVSTGIKATNVAVLDWAVPPVAPDRPSLSVNAALGLIAGLGLGLGAAFLREYLDTTVKTSDEVGRFVGAPALAMIPSVASLGADRRSNLDLINFFPVSLRARALERAGQWHRIDCDGEKSAELADAFAVLRTSIMPNSDATIPRTLLVTSAQPGEGKTTVAINLAISLTQLQHRVLLIDADVRRPCVHTALGLRNRTGLGNFLRGDEENWQSLVQEHRPTGLMVLTSGPSSTNAANLLSSPRMRELLPNAMAEFDFVILDSPAVLLNAADARIMARLVHGTLLVVRSGFTPRDLVQCACAQMPKVVGVIVNGFDPTRLPGVYGTYYAAGAKPVRPADYARVGSAGVRPSVENTAIPARTWIKSLLKSSSLIRHLERAWMSLR